MKFLLILFFILFSTLSSKSIDNNSLKLKESKKVWLKYKKESNNTYTYYVNFVSWSGFGYETQIEVEKGIFVKRKFSLWNKTKEKTWIEEKEELGTHKEGAALKLIDDLYNECSDILVNTNKNTNNIYLKLDENGLLKKCLFAPKNCSDDCSNGVEIKEINFSK
ncbi:MULTISPECIES: hypothetical protein [Arcobacteraceae]|uniref:Uncharacterized protein n=1 Tax=Poseidonibacter parvus TaxID=1850254 RepID=A0A1P8KN87_9BACT|nr:MULTISPECIES: hypothetical protein [Arcobacteraceae]APW65998.1 hypothetical protein LPB137_09080 [Poseidonibacter parvus]